MYWTALLFLFFIISQQFGTRISAQKFRLHLRVDNIYITVYNWSKNSIRLYFLAFGPKIVYNSVHRFHIFDSEFWIRRIAKSMFIRMLCWNAISTQLNRIIWLFNFISEPFHEWCSPDAVTSRQSANVPAIKLSKIFCQQLSISQRESKNSTSRHNPFWICKFSRASA